jgi:hypothetical protein
MCDYKGERRRKKEKEIYMYTNDGNYLKNVGTAWSSTYEKNIMIRCTCAIESSALEENGMNESIRRKTKCKKENKHKLSSRRVTRVIFAYNYGTRAALVGNGCH